MIDGRPGEVGLPGSACRWLVLVDTSAWLWHARFGDPVLDSLIAQSIVLGHVEVAGEIAMGHPPRSTRFRDRVLALPTCGDVPPRERLEFVQEHAISGAGIGWVDAGLVASCKLDARPVAIYTRDQRLADVARRLGIPAVSLPTSGPGSAN